MISYVIEQNIGVVVILFKVNSFDPIISGTVLSIEFIEYFPIGVSVKDLKRNKTFGFITNPYAFKVKIEKITTVTKHFMMSCVHGKINQSKWTYI